MMFVNDLYLSSLFILFSHLILTETTEILMNNTIINSTSNVNMTFDGNVTALVTTRKTLLIQGQEMIHDSFSKIDRGTLVRGVIVLAGITCLILMYIGVQTFVLRKRRQTRRYKLLSNATTMEEPLFNGPDDEEEEKEDDTLFVRK